jgi:hypothetical protein
MGRLSREIPISRPMFLVYEWTVVVTVREVSVAVVRLEHVQVPVV